MSRVLYALAFCVAMLLTVSASRRAHEHTHTGVERAHLDAERERITAHLTAVEQRLRAADVSHLTDGQRAARARHLDVLREYRLSGRFPHNHGVSEGRTPIFVDEHGTHCAVGYLLARAGKTELVARIASTRNLATVAELADEPGLVEWLDANGLTAEEAGQIQPAYSPPEQRSERDGDYLATTLGLSAVSGAAAAWNVLAEESEAFRYLRGLTGFLSGIASVGWGVEGIGRESTEWSGGINSSVQITRKPGTAEVALNFIAGAVTGVLGTRTLFANRAATQGRTAEDEAPLQLEITPTGNGLRAAIRF
jgi:hypothetical protein